ncbi:MAG: LutB/LldF family L-lactate oxidation iron-sulfur protein [Solirubrobacteraceae bacterium]
MNTTKSDFPDAAARALEDSQLRHNLRNATHTIRDKRGRAVAEVPEWEQLRRDAARIKDEVLGNLDVHLRRLEETVTAAGGQVHWARDAAEACVIVTGLVRAEGATEAIKMKSLTTDEIGLNTALQRAGVQAWETDLAEMIIQLAGDKPSHILVPAIHLGRSEIRDLFAASFGIEDLSDDPHELTAVARAVLRERFMRVPVGISGVNFAIAETGTIVLVESEGNGRMCTTLPQTLISIMGIEKVLPSLSDLGAMLALLPRSSTGERMNPYTTLFTGVSKGDGPQKFHLVLLDNGRTNALADPVGREALRCIRCSACMNICPIYERAGGHAYESVYPGPIGAIISPQLAGLREHRSLPWASSLCGACAEVCPMKIDIPRLIVHLRGRIAHETDAEPASERAAMRLLAQIFLTRRRYETAQRALALGRTPLRSSRVTRALPGPLAAWAAARELPPIPQHSFREWWATHEEGDAIA